jgi:hypothetical protein
VENFSDAVNTGEESKYIPIKLIRNLYNRCLRRFKLHHSVVSIKVIEDNQTNPLFYKPAKGDKHEAR